MTSHHQGTDAGSKAADDFHQRRAIGPRHDVVHEHRVETSVEPQNFERLVCIGGIPAADIPDQGRRLAAKFDALVEPLLSAPRSREILDMLTGLGGAPEATALGGGERLPLVHAAMLNAYQIHAQEFDCVHEAAVVHPMAASVPVLLGWAEREGGVSGARLIRALVVAVNVAATLGLCSRAPMRFFRPANGGGVRAPGGVTF